MTFENEENKISFLAVLLCYLENVNVITHSATAVIIPRETEGYGVELVRLSVRPSVCLSVRPSVRPSPLT